MDSAAFLAALETGLRPLVAAAGGRVDVASDPDEVFELLAVSPTGWRVILSFGGDEAVDPDGAPGVVRWTLNSTVQAARGLALKRHAHGHRTPVSGRDPLLALASQVSAWIRGFSGSHPDLHPNGFRHLSQNWLVIDEIPTRQVILAHRCTLALDPPVEVPCVFPQ
jgi:hypothetical protein